MSVGEERAGPVVLDLAGWDMGVGLLDGEAVEFSLRGWGRKRLLVEQPDLRKMAGSNRLRVTLEAVDE